MSKPIIIQATDWAQPGPSPEPLYTVQVDHKQASAFGARKRKGGPVDGYAFRTSKGQIDFHPEATPVGWTKDEAMHIAHSVGRYMMGFGDLVFAYTSAPEGFFEEGES